MMIRADLHIHSCLSPCGSLFSSPLQIARQALSAGLDLIALTDHNSSRNCPCFLQACQQVGISGICGMEATSREEVHCLCYFPDLETAMNFDAYIDEHLLKFPLNPERMGDQVIVNIEEEIVDTIDHLLISATDLSIEELAHEVHGRNGLFVPAHVDRSAFSLTSQLGFIPEGSYDGLEWFFPRNPQIQKQGRFKALFNSDAHMLEYIGSKTTEFPGTHPGFSALRAWLLSD